MNIHLFNLAQRSTEEIKIVFSVSGYDPENWLRMTRISEKAAKPV